MVTLCVFMPFSLSTAAIDVPEAHRRNIKKRAGETGLKMSHGLGVGVFVRACMHES